MDCELTRLRWNLKDKVLEFDKVDFYGRHSFYHDYLNTELPTPNEASCARDI